MLHCYLHTYHPDILPPHNTKHKHIIFGVQVNITRLDLHHVCSTACFHASPSCCHACKQHTKHVNYQKLHMSVSIYSPCTVDSSDHYCNLFKGHTHSNGTVVACLQVVEASAAANKLVTRSSLNESSVKLAPLEGFVVAFPTMNAIHGQDSWGAEYVSDKYADHSAWDVHTIIGMLHRFFAVSGAVSLPDLAEYEWRLDKVSMLPYGTPACQNGTKEY